jgi:CubicO group peptidase (beta-lactamase class C family)
VKVKVFSEFIQNPIFVGLNKYRILFYNETINSFIFNQHYKSMKNYIILCLILLIFSQKNTAQTTSDSLIQELNQIYSKSKYPGFSVTVVNKNGVLFQKAFGFANVQEKIPYTPQTLQHIGSVSKTFIAAALMKAIDEGYFTFETNINDILPFKVVNPNFPDKPIKIKHLVTHTSGILETDKFRIKLYKVAKHNSPEILQSEMYKEYVRYGIDTKDIETTLATFLPAYLSSKGRWYSKKNFSNSEPGKRYEYSNIGSVLAAYLIEVKSGMSFAEFSEKNTLKAIKMNSSGWVLDKIDLTKHAKLYDIEGKALPLYSTPATFPDGGFITNAEDLGKYLTEMLKGYAGESSLLSKESFQTMFKAQFSAADMPENMSPREPNRAVFWHFNRKGAIGHTGDDWGVTAILSFDPKTGIGKFFITNIEFEDFRGKTNPPLLESFKQIWQVLDKISPK